jgi:hypothetical protein
MALATIDLNIEAGATYSGLSIVVRNSDNTLMSLTGYTGQLQIRKSPASSTAVITVTPTITTGTSTVSFTIPANQTSLLDGGVYVWALEITASGGEPVLRLAEGSVYVSAEVVK